MWVVKLTDKQLEVLRAVLRAEEHLGPALRGALESLDLARWDECPRQLPWEDVRDAARRQGISEADVIWDLGGQAQAHRRVTQYSKNPAPALRPSLPSPISSSIRPGGR